MGTGNRWLFAGSDAGCFRTVAGALGTSALSALDTGWCNCSLSLAPGNIAAADFTDTTGAADTVGAGETLWAHFIRRRTGSANAVYNELRVVDASDFAWIAIRWKAGTTFGLFYNSGTGAAPVWTQFGADFSLPNIDLVLDIAVTLGSPHSVSLYIDSGSGSAFNQTATFTQAAFTGARALHFETNDGTNFFGSVLCSVGLPTINAHCAAIYPTGAGTTNTFTSGTVTSIDELGVDDGDVMTSAAAAQRATFVYADVPSLGVGFTVTDFFLFTRAKNDGTNPGFIRPVHRNGVGTETVGPSFTSMDLTFKPLVARYLMTKADFDASQFGFESSDT